MSLKKVTDYQQSTLFDSKSILGIEPFRAVKVFIKNKEVYYSLDIKVLENPSPINIIVDETIIDKDDYDSFRRMCFVF